MDVVLGKGFALILLFESQWFKVEMDHTLLYSRNQLLPFLEISQIKLTVVLCWFRSKSTKFLNHASYAHFQHKGVMWMCWLFHFLHYWFLLCLSCLTCCVLVSFSWCHFLHDKAIVTSLIFLLVDNFLPLNSWILQEWVVNFEKPKGDPSAFMKPATTLLSPYLKVIFIYNMRKFRHTEVS